MKIINCSKLPESVTTSPKGKFGRANRDVSMALGRNPESTDLRHRHPFDVQICRIPPGKARCPFHLHTGQWEFFHVISGAGSVRHREGTAKIGKDDAFIFEPGDPHQLINDGAEDLVICIVADNPIGDACHYPDSGKWAIAPGLIVKVEPADYFDGEE